MTELAGNELDAAVEDALDYAIRQGAAAEFTMKGRSVAGIVAGLLLAGAAGAVWGQRRKRHVALPSRPDETLPVKDESVEHAALRDILEKSVAYNEALYKRVQALELLGTSAERVEALARLTTQNQDARKDIDALRVALQAHLDEKNLRFCDVDGFTGLVSHFRFITLEQQERHLELYHRVRLLPGVSDTPELHSYLKLGFSDETQKHADSAEQIRQATAEQRELMLRVGRLLAGVKDAGTAEPVPAELLSISARYQSLTQRMHLYRDDDPEGVAEALVELKKMYAALTPPLKEQSAQLRGVGCYGNEQLHDILTRLLPDKKSS